jgi:hypothetical protein
MEASTRFLEMNIKYLSYLLDCINNETPKTYHRNHPFSSASLAHAVLQRGA